MDINPDLQLEHGERSMLTQLTVMEGYRILHRLMRSEVDKFLIRTINADPAKPQEVLSAQMLAKAAAQFYQGITDRINEEVLQYTASPKADDKPTDPTEVLDLGDLAEQLDGVPNILEEIL